MAERKPRKKSGEGEDLVKAAKPVVKKKAPVKSIKPVKPRRKKVKAPSTLEPAAVQQEQVVEPVVEPVIEEENQSVQDQPVVQDQPLTQDQSFVDSQPVVQDQPVAQDFSNDFASQFPQQPDYSQMPPIFDDQPAQPSEPTQQPEPAPFEPAPHTEPAQMSEPASQQSSTEPSWDDLVAGFGSTSSEPAKADDVPQQQSEPQPEPQSEPSRFEIEKKENESYKSQDFGASYAHTAIDQTVDDNQAMDDVPKTEKILPEERFASFEETVESKPHSAVTDDDKVDFVGEIKHYLKNFVSGRNLKNCFVGVVVITVVIALVYFGGAKWISNTWNKIFKSSNTVVVDPGKIDQKKEQQKFEDFVKAGVDVGYDTGLAYGTETGILTQALQTAYLIGMQHPKNMNIDTGLQTAFNTGFQGPLLDDTVFKIYVKTFFELKNAYETDIYAMLNASENRVATLDAIQNGMDDVYKRSNDQFALIKIELDGLKTESRALNAPKKKAETDFFASLKAGKAQDSSDQMEEFIMLSQKQSELSVRYNGLSALRDYYQIVLKKMALRIDDIKKNRDALIQGIRVIEVQNSNVDIIIKQSKSSSTGQNVNSSLGGNGVSGDMIPSQSIFQIPTIQLQ